MELNQNQQLAASTSFVAPPLAPSRPRCQYVSRNGKPCRNRAASPEQLFCKNHLPPPPPGSPEEFANTLEELADNFDSPEGVNRVMYTLFFALVENKITERKAGILTYMAQTILHSHRAIAWKAKLDAEAAKNEQFKYPLTWNLPGRPKKETSTPENTEKAAATDKQEKANLEKANVEEAATPEEKGASGEEQSAARPNTTRETNAAEPPRPPDLHHFFPRDPSLPVHLQDPARLSAPPPGQAEIDRRNRQFDRAHGFRRRTQRTASSEDSDWKIINGR